MSEKENISNIPIISKMSDKGIHKYTYEPKYDGNIITSEKFDADTWALIEKVPDQDEIKRLHILQKLGNNTYRNDYTEESKLFTIGNPTSFTL